MNHRRIAIIPAMLFALLCGDQWARAENELPEILREVRFDQRLDQQLPLDLEFTDESGRSLKLGAYFGEKPVILVLAYYQCPMLCTQVLNGLVRGMLEMSFDAGNQFNVVTVSFDPRETPAMAAAKKKTYLERYGRPGAEQGWHFLTGRADEIRQLTDAVGFRFVYDEQRAQFAHASGIMVLTPGGKISRYFYDVAFRGRDLRLGLVEASQNKIGSPVDQILLFCFHYDPAEGKYGPVVMNFVRAGGALTLLGLAALLAVLFKRDRRRNKPALVAGLSVGQG